MNKVYFYHLTNLAILLYFVIACQSCGKVIKTKTVNHPINETRDKEQDQPIANQDERLASINNELDQAKNEAESLKVQVKELEESIELLNEVIDNSNDTELIDGLQDQINERDQQLNILIAQNEETQEKLDLLELEFNALKDQVNEETEDKEKPKKDKDHHKEKNKKCKKKA